MDIIVFLLHSESAVTVRFHRYDVGQESREVDLFLDRKVFGVGSEHGFNVLDMLLFRGLVRDVIPAIEPIEHVRGLI